MFFACFEEKPSGSFFNLSELFPTILFNNQGSPIFGAVVLGDEHYQSTVQWRDGPALPRACVFISLYIFMFVPENNAWIPKISSVRGCSTDVPCLGPSITAPCSRCPAKSHPCRRELLQLKPIIPVAVETQHSANTGSFSQMLLYSLALSRALLVGMPCQHLAWCRRLGCAAIALVEQKDTQKGDKSASRGLYCKPSTAFWWFSFLQPQLDLVWL